MNLQAAVLGDVMEYFEDKCHISLPHVYLLNDRDVKVFIQNSLSVDLLGLITFVS